MSPLGGQSDHNAPMSRMRIPLAEAFKRYRDLFAVVASCLIVVSNNENVGVLEKAREILPPLTGPARIGSRNEPKGTQIVRVFFALNYENSPASSNALDEFGKLIGHLPSVANSPYPSAVTSCVVSSLWSLRGVALAESPLARSGRPEKGARRSRRCNHSWRRFCRASSLPGPSQASETWQPDKAPPFLATPAPRPYFVLSYRRLGRGHHLPFFVSWS